MPPPYSGHYGTLGIPSATSVPPGRASYTKWGRGADDIFIFGGMSSFSSDDFNDVWKFNFNSKMWTWLGGDSAYNNLGSVTNHCVAASTNIPKARYENQTVHSNSPCSKAFWSFGGFSSTGSINDLWIYDSYNNKWIMVWGDLTNGVVPSNYGNLGVSSATNAIPDRGGLCIWTDDKENIWVFGGTDINGALCFNDMWRFIPDTSCFNIIAANSSFSWPTNKTVICKGDTANFYFPSSTVITTVPTMGVVYDINTGKLSLAPSSNQTYTITAKTPANHPCPIDETKDLVIEVKHLPIADFELNPTSTSSFNPYFGSINKSIDADSFKWTYINNIISTSRDFQKKITTKGTHCFTVEAMNQCGSDYMTKCGQFSDILIPNVFSPNGDDKNDIFRIINPEEVEIGYLSIFNRWGQKVFHTTNKNLGWDGTFKGIKCEMGTYFYIIGIKNSENNVLKGDVTLLR